MAAYALTLILLILGPLFFFLNFIAENHNNFHYIVPQTGWVGSVNLTIIYGLTTSLFQCLIGVFLASIFYLNFWDRNILKIAVIAILILPYAVPSTISVMLFDFAMQSEGYLNIFLRDTIGVLSHSIQATQLGRFITLTIISIWQYTPFFFIAALIGFTAIPNNILIQAVCDGASKTRIIFSILLPIAAPAIIAAFALRIILMLGKVDIALAFHEKSVLGGAETLPVQIVTEIFSFGNLIPFGQILILAVVICIPLLFYTRYVNRDQS